jgi:peptide/nickel transport system substrate-binding protein
MESFVSYYGNKPYASVVEFKIYASSDAAFASLLDGSVDIFPYLTRDQADQLTQDYNIEQGNNNLVQALFLNNASGPFANADVRRALFYVIDVPELMEALNGPDSGSQLRSGFFHGFGLYYNDALDGTYAYDPEVAKSLLAGAGYAGGFEFTITVPSNYEYHVQTAQIIAEQLKSVGIDAHIELIEWTSWLSEVFAARDYEATIIGLDTKLAPSDLMRRYTTTASNNFINYSNAEFDRIFERATASTDTGEKISLYKELQRLLNEDAASVYLQDPPLLVAVKKGLSGYTFYPVLVIDMSKVH